MSLVGLTLTDNVAHASSYLVTTTADGGAGSLRDAITQANANPGPDTITIPAGTYTLTIAGRGEDANLTGDLDVTGATTIIGAGAGSTIIDAAGIDRVFDIVGGPTVLQGLTITNGAPAVGVTASGGDIKALNYTGLTIQDSIVSNGSSNYGGGVLADQGVLTVLRSEFVGNSVVGYFGNGGAAAAIFKTKGSLVLTDSLVADNHAGTVGILAANAAIYVTGGVMTARNSTISGNSAYAWTVLLEAYGATTVGTSTFDHVTIANNTTVSGGAGLGLNLISPAVMPVTVTGSLFVNNHTGAPSRNCSFQGGGGGVITSGGYNLSDDTTCPGFTQASDLNNNQLTTLGALANNGGPTRTLALVAGSSAIDAAGACGSVTPTDQRAVSRPQGVACDMGAYEVGAAVVPTTTSTTNAPTTTDAPTTSDAPTSVAPGSTLAEPPISVDNGGIGATTLPPETTIELIYRGQLPVTGDNHATSLWLALLACSMGALLVLTARRLAR